MKTKKLPVGAWVGQKIDHFRTEFLTLGSAATLGPGSNLVSVNLQALEANFTAGNALFTAGLILLGFSLKSSIDDKSKMRESSEKIDALSNLLSQSQVDYYGSWDNFCKEVFPSLRLTNECRFSIYRHSPQSSEFYLIGRYAPNPHNCMRGRSAYPDQQGCIGSAWRNGECSESKLPNPISNMVRYLEENEKRWGLPRDVSANLRMKSQSLWAYALTRDAHRFAVVVVESERKDALDVGQLKKSFDDE